MNMFNDMRNERLGGDISQITLSAGEFSLFTAVDKAVNSYK